MVMDKEFYRGPNWQAMYSWIYHGFTTEYKLKPVSVILLAIIASYHSDSSVCCLSIQSMSKMAGTTPPTVIKHLRILKKLGLIESTMKHPRYGTNQWQLGLVGEAHLFRLQEIIENRKNNKLKK